MTHLSLDPLATSFPAFDRCQAHQQKSLADFKVSCWPTAAIQHRFKQPVHFALSALVGLLALPAFLVAYVALEMPRNIRKVIDADYAARIKDAALNDTLELVSRMESIAKSDMRLRVLATEAANLNLPYTFTWVKGRCGSNMDPFVMPDTLTLHSICTAANKARISTDTLAPMWVSTDTLATVLDNFRYEPGEITFSLIEGSE